MSGGAEATGVKSSKRRRIEAEKAERQECITSKCLWNVGNETLKGGFLSKEARNEQSYLLTAKVVEEKRLGSGKSDPWKLTLEGNDIRGTRMFALFKPYRTKDLQGRRSAEESIASEYGGYLVSQALGVTSATGVVRTLELGPDRKPVTGFLQVWVGGAPLENFTPEAMTKIVDEDHAAEFDAIALMDFLLGNGDRGQPTREDPHDVEVHLNLGNFLISGVGTKDEKVVAIDHGDAFNYGAFFEPGKRNAYYRKYVLPPHVSQNLLLLKNDVVKREALEGLVYELLGPAVGDVFRERLTLILGALKDDGTVHLEMATSNGK